jgi:peptide-methionine (R)-S-oxide reductase
MSQLLARYWVFMAAAAVFCQVSSLAARAQDPLANAPLAPGSAISGDASDKSKSDSTGKSSTKARAMPEPEFVVKTDAEWRKILTRAQYAVTRQRSTEQPWSGKYATGHFKGIFLCVCCDAPLFSADAKFESGTGWPSFDRPVSVRAILTAPDYGELEPRMEVMCRRCRAHLGHVFDDGPTLTHFRFCINSAALKLKSSEAETSAKTVPTKTSSKTKAKAKTKPSAQPVPTSTELGDRVSPADSDRPVVPAAAKASSSSPSSGERNAPKP